MILANPMYIWSLLGLAIPIAIHFLSRKDGKIIKLGSIRHVKETSTQQFRGIRLNEIFLLFLRCALIIILSLILSGLHFDQKNRKWIVVESGAEKNKNVATAIDSLERQGYEPHWLTKSFPSLSSFPDTSLINYWSVLSDLEKINPEEAIVFSFLKAKNFKGQMKAIPSTIRLIPVEPEENKFVPEATQEGDSVSLRIGTSNSSVTSFETKKVKTAHDSVHVTLPRQVKIVLVSDKKYLRERHILLAAVRAIDKKTSPMSLSVVEKEVNHLSENETSDWIFWITDAKSPETKSNVLKWSPKISNNLIEQSKKNEWLLTQPLNEEIALKKNFIFSLGSLLTFNPTAEKITSESDQRMLPETMAFKSAHGEKIAALTTPSSSPSWLIALLVALLLFERYFSYRRNQ